MKKYLVLILFALISISALSQHMKFMGIPLNGTIAQFTTKLQQKGVTISSANKYSGNDCRFFSGIFYGKEARIFVFYIPSTKLVYRAKVVFEFDNADRRDEFKNEIYNKIINKYNSEIKTSWLNDYISYKILIDLGVRSDIYEGRIDLFYSYEYTYSLHIDYYDCVNYEKYQACIDADL